MFCDNCDNAKGVATPHLCICCLNVKLCAPIGYDCDGDPLYICRPCIVRAYKEICKAEDEP